MTRGEFPRLAVKAIFISLLIQVPFIFLMNLGVHSVAGGVGYVFYYPWILLLESLYRTSGESWQNNLAVYETVLCLLQTIPLSAIVFFLMAFKQPPGLKGGSAGGHT
jgi:hypothetical protein